MNAILRRFLSKVYRVLEKASEEEKDARIRKYANLTIGSDVKFFPGAAILNIGEITLGNNTWFVGRIMLFLIIKNVLCQ